jgi:hypothetical protein
LVGDDFLLLAQAGTIEVFNAVLLNQQPDVATLPEGLHEFIERVGVIGQVHFRW